MRISFPSRAQHRPAVEAAHPQASGGGDPASNPPNLYPPRGRLRGVATGHLGTAGSVAHLPPIHLPQPPKVVVVGTPVYPSHPIYWPPYPRQACRRFRRIQSRRAAPVAARQASGDRLTKADAPDSAARPTRLGATATEARQFRPPGGGSPEYPTNLPEPQAAIGISPTCPGRAGCGPITRSRPSRRLIRMRRIRTTRCRRLRRHHPHSK